MFKDLAIVALTNRVHNLTIEVNDYARKLICKSILLDMAEIDTAELLKRLATSEAVNNAVKAINERLHASLLSAREGRAKARERADHLGRVNGELRDKLNESQRVNEELLRQRGVLQCRLQVTVIAL